MECFCAVAVVIAISWFALSVVAIKVEAIASGVVTNSAHVFDADASVAGESILETG